MRCFLCRQSYCKGWKAIDTSTCSSSKKDLKSVLIYLAELTNIELHIPRGEYICNRCYLQISEYDAFLVRTVQKQRDLVQLIEKALVCVDTDFEEECENEMRELDNELEDFDDVQVSDEEISNVLREAMGKKRKYDDTRNVYINNSRQIPDVTYQCQFCAMTFKAKTPYQRHLNQAHKKFSCEICDYSHRNEDYVLLHMNLHEGRSENQCRYCDKEFTTKISTIRHMEVHFDTKKYQCDKCGLCFSQTTVLYNHKLQHEAEEKPLRCNICNTLFKTKRTFRHHQMIHNEHRPRHTCEYCGRNFTEKYTLKVHKRTHHDDQMALVKDERPSLVESMVTEEVSTTETEFLPQEQQQTSVGGTSSENDINKFSCIICDQQFPSRDQMNKHMEKDHDVIFKSLALSNIPQYEVVDNEATKKPCHICGQTFFTQNNFDYHLENDHGISFK